MVGVAHLAANGFGNAFLNRVAAAVRADERFGVRVVFFQSGIGRASESKDSHKAERKPHENPSMREQPTGSEPSLQANNPKKRVGAVLDESQVWSPPHARSPASAHFSERPMHPIRQHPRRLPLRLDPNRRRLSAAASSRCTFG